MILFCVCELWSNHKSVSSHFIGEVNSSNQRDFSFGATIIWRGQTTTYICNYMQKKEKEIVAFIHIIFSIAHKKYFRNNFKNSIRILFLIQKETNGTFANFDNFTRQSSVTKIMTLSSIVRTRNLWFGGKKLHKGKNRICSSVQAWKWFVISFHTK